MSQYSKSMERGQFCMPCQNGNIFYLGNPDGASCPPIKGFVNNQAAGSLPMCVPITDKTQETTGAVELEIGGQKYPLIKDISEYDQCRIPNQVQVHIGLAKPVVSMPQSTATPTGSGINAAANSTQAYVPVGQVSSMRPPGTFGLIKQGYETNALDVIGDQNALTGHYTAAYNQASGRTDVIVLEPENLSDAPSDGDHDAESTDPAVLAWFSEEIGKIMKMTGGQAIKIGFLAAEGQNLAFLRKEGLTRFYIKRINGKPNIILKGASGLRNILTGTRYTTAGLGTRQVSVMNAAARTAGGNLRAGATGVASKAGAVGFIFVCVIDTINYFSTPSGERALSDLLVDIGFNAVKAVVSGIAGTVAAGFAIAVAGTFGAPVVVAVAIGLGVAFLAGWVASTLIDATGLEEGLKKAIRNSEHDELKLYEGMMTAP